MLEMHINLYQCTQDILADTAVVLLRPEQAMQEQDRVAYDLIGLRAIHLVRQFLPTDAGRGECPKTYSASRSRPSEQHDAI